jgi:maltose alpha-D-glucosyltransferase/alpha-amylase
MLRTFRELLQWRRGDAIILGEANILPSENIDYFGEDGDRLQMLFNFPLNQALFYGLAAADRRPLAKALALTRDKPSTAQWGIFLRNHDELDLGRLPKRQREAIFAAFGPEKTHQLYDRGIRRRLAPMLDSDRRRLELAYSLMLTLPGTPVFRYGDEIAMGDDLSLPERECARTPMQWSNEPHGGFTKSDKPVCPVIADGPYGYRHLNVAIQRRSPDSFLNWLERMIRMRKEVPEIAWGDYEVLDHDDPAVLILRYHWRRNYVMFLHNLAGEAREVRFKASDEDGIERSMINLLAEDHSEADANGAHAILLEPYGYRWFRIGGLDYLLKRSPI